MIDVEQIEIRFDYHSPEAEDITRCLQTLYATREGSQPLDRKFGVSWDFIDKPLPVAKAEYAFEVIRKTREYESRVKVKEVTYEVVAKSGLLRPVILLVKGDEG